MDAIDLTFNSTQLVKIIDNCWDSILIVDRNSKIVYTNNSFLMLIGYPKDKVLGSPFDLFLHSKSQNEFEKLLEKIQSSDVQSFLKVVCTSKDGHDIAFHIGMLKIKDSELVVLNMKHIHEPSLVSSDKAKVSANQNADMKKDLKKDGDILDKTFGWLNGANKAIESMFHTTSKEKQPTSKSKTTKKYIPSSFLTFPKEIDEMNRDTLREYVKNDIDTFESIGYKDFTKDQLIAAKEWHTWQVSIMLQLYKMGDSIFIPEKENIFPESIKELTKNSLERVIQNMISNYKNRANPNAKKEILSKDAKWSAMEVGCLLYFLLE